MAQPKINLFGMKHTGQSFNISYPTPFLDYDTYHYNIIFGLVNVFIGTVGTIFNGFALWILSKKDFKKHPSTVFNLNLCISDLGLLVTNVPLNAPSQFYQRWLFGFIGCKIYGFCGGLFGLMSINTIALMAIERLKGLNAKRSGMFEPDMGACLMLTATLCVWMYCLVWNLFPVTGYFTRYIYEGVNNTACSFDYKSQDPPTRIFNVMFITFCFFIQVIVIVSCFAYIVMKVKSHEQKYRTILNPTYNISLIHRQITKTYTVTKSCAYMFIGFMIAWSPYAIVCLMGILGFPDSISPFATQFCATIAKMSAMYNPIIYLLNKRNLKLIRERFFERTNAFVDSSDENTQRMLKLRRMGQVGDKLLTGNGQSSSSTTANSKRIFEIQKSAKRRTCSPLRKPFNFSLKRTPESF